MWGSIYRSPEGEARIRALYESELKGLGIDCKRTIVSTRFGSAHVISAGPPDAPPLVLVHSLFVPAPYAIELFMPLAAGWRIYAPDVAGQTGLSSAARPGAKGNGYGRWLADVLDGLGIERAPMLGISFGAAVILDLAAFSPARITRAVLVTPAGLVKGMAPKLFIRLSLPWALYRFFPAASKRLMRRLWDRRVGYDERFFNLFDAVMRDVKLFVMPPGPFSREDLRDFTSPALVMLAKDDALIPVELARRRASEIIPNLSGTVVFDGPHIPGKEARSLINEKVSEFLGGEERRKKTAEVLRFKRGRA